MAWNGPRMVIRYPNSDSSYKLFVFATDKVDVIAHLSSLPVKMSIRIEGSFVKGNCGKSSNRQRFCEARHVYLTSTLTGASVMISRLPAGWAVASSRFLVRGSFRNSQCYTTQPSATCLTSHAKTYD